MSLNFSFDFSVSSFPRNISCAVASKPLLFSCVRSPFTLEYGDQFVFLSHCKTKHEINNFHLPVYCVFLMVALGSYFHGFYVHSYWRFTFEHRNFCDDTVWGEMKMNCFECKTLISLIDQLHVYSPKLFKTTTVTEKSKTKYGMN